MNVTYISLSEEESKDFTDMSIAAAEAMCIVLGIRFVIEDGKVKGIEI